MRERIDVSEIEAQTKIRAKYLRALENEEWDLLPGPTFVKSFLRTYATALGLDGKALVEEYRLSYERPSEPPEPIVSSPRRVRMPTRPGRAGRPSGGSGGPGAGGLGPRSAPSRGYIALVGVVGVLVVLLIVGLLSGGGGGSNNATTTTGASANGHAAHGRPHTGARGTGVGGAPLATDVISLQLKATGAVYVCLLGEGGRKLVDGHTFEAGTGTPVYHGKHFVLTLGNNSVELLIDGKPRVVPASSTAIGYSITKAGRRTLAPGTLPTCT